MEHLSKNCDFLLCTRHRTKARRPFASLVFNRKACLSPMNFDGGGIGNSCNVKFGAFCEIKSFKWKYKKKN